MRTIVKYRWAILALWIALAAGLFFTAPDMQDLVRERGQLTIPEGSPSLAAGKLLEEIDGDGTAAVLVFTSEDGLDDEEIREIKQAVDRLSEQSDELGLTNIVSPFGVPELEEQMVSEDGTTVLVMLGLDSADLSTSEQRDGLNEVLQDVGVEHYLTGSSLIDEDVIISSQEGLKRTELITVIFILVILIVVFRSVVTPWIPLLTIGISYLTAQSVVAYLVEYMDFPLSTFTQIFMVAVMFGIGTDYCILLISRFREELAAHSSTTEAIAATYRTAGRTVLFSWLAVLAGFAAIGLSKFILYQSAVAVAVGVTVMMIALFTLMPFFMAVLGKALFWPSSRALQHKDNRVWGFAGSFSLRRPLITLGIIAVIVVPLLWQYDGDVSYNSLDEIGDGYDSVKAFNIIAEKFGPGESLPASVVLKHDEALDSPQGMAWIEKISRELLHVDGVSAVRSATRPTGEEIAEFLVTDQAAVLQEGLTQGADGIMQIRDGLALAGRQLTSSEPQLEEAVQAVGALVDGTQEVAAGLNQLSNGLGEIAYGVRQGAAGAAELHSGVQELKLNAERLRSSYEQLAAGYHELSEGMNQLAEHYGQIESGLDSLSQGLSGLEQALGSVSMNHPNLSEDETFLTALGLAEQLQDAAEELLAGVKQLNRQLAVVQAGLSEVGGGFGQANAGYGEMVAAFDALLAGLDQLEQGLQQAADGQDQIAQQMPGAVHGLQQVVDGQRRLYEGVTGLTDQLELLTGGIQQSVDGLTQIGEGLTDAVSYLEVLSTNSSADLGGWYMPEEAFELEEFAQVFDTYMSEDRRTVKFEVIFEGHPYEQGTLELIEPLNAAVERAVKGTPLEDAAYAVGGVTSMYHDLSEVSQEDFNRTAVIMLIGIFLVLMILLRSLVMPIYLMASLLLTYYTSMAAAEWIFVDLAGYAGITWAVPFFAFVMLVALGIDYSIFLMGRFNEYRHLDVQEAILEAMKKMGSVIFSAVIILGGTFAAMLPSGVLSLLQIATIVLTGLFLYALVFLPLFIPMMVKLFGEANWWPFGRAGTAEQPPEQPSV